VHQKTEGFFRATCKIERFAAEVLNPQLVAILAPSPTEACLIRTYWRMYNWTKSLTRLNDPSDYQAIAAAARAMFEHVVDFEILDRNQSGLEIKRYFNFEQIEKFRVAQNLVQSRSVNPQFVDHDYRALADFIAEPGRSEGIQSLRAEIWAGIPQRDQSNLHWSGRKLSARTRELGGDYPFLYSELYSQLSWHIHSGGVGSDGMSMEDVESLIGLAHGEGQKFFLRMIERLAKILRIRTAIDRWDEMLEELKLSAGAFIHDARQQLASTPEK
jgi:hypothetical protein